MHEDIPDFPCTLLTLQLRKFSLIADCLAKNVLIESSAQVQKSAPFSQSEIYLGSTFEDYL
jgi:hypothetical protein